MEADTKNPEKMDVEEIGIYCTTSSDGDMDLEDAQEEVAMAYKGGNLLETLDEPTLYQCIGFFSNELRRRRKGKEGK